MPIISCFFGVVVKMYFDDHNPPHFHAEYQGREALFLIENGACVEGHLPSRAIRLVSDWTVAHKKELMDDWQLAQSHQPLNKIPGADND